MYIRGYIERDNDGFCIERRVESLARARWMCIEAYVGCATRARSAPLSIHLARIFLFKTIDLADEILWPSHEVVTALERRVRERGFFHGILDFDEFSPCIMDYLYILYTHIAHQLYILNGYVQYRLASFDCFCMHLLFRRITV